MRSRLAVLNGKGGTLKTTLATNLAGQVAAAGGRVLLVDLDPQGNCRLDLGVAGGPHDDEGRGLAQALLFATPVQPVPVRERLDLVVGGPLLGRIALTPEMRGAALAALAGVEERYDLVVLDSAPGAGELRMLTLTTATALLLPTQVDAAGLVGVEHIARDFRTIKRSTNPTLDVVGAVVGPVPSTATAVIRTARAALSGLLGAAVPVFEPAVPYSVATATLARSNGLLVHELAARLATDRTAFTSTAAVTPPADSTLAAIADAYRRIAQQTVDAIATTGQVLS